MFCLTQLPSSIRHFYFDVEMYVCTVYMFEYDVKMELLIYFASCKSLSYKG